MPAERTSTIPGADSRVALFARWIGSDGPTVVALHGGPGASQDYLRPQFDRLATGRTLLYYDQRGGGQSPAPHEVPLDWHAHVADLETVVRAHGAPPTTLLGFSWGGLLALLFTLEYPDLVGRLALISPAPTYAEARREYLQEFERRHAAPAVAAAREELARSGLLGRDPEAYRKRAFELAVAGYFREPSRARALTPFRVASRAQHAVWDSLRNTDLRMRVGAVRQPTLILHGRHDPVPVHASELLATLLPNARLVVFEDSGHALYLEETDAFVSELDAFLPRAGERGAGSDAP